MGSNGAGGEEDLTRLEVKRKAINRGERRNEYRLLPSRVKDGIVDPLPLW
jgi:hypothetical protein